MPCLDRELDVADVEAERLCEPDADLEVFLEAFDVPRVHGPTDEGALLRPPERVLLRNASEKTKRKLIDAANRLLPTFVEHALWRPRERAFIGSAMRERDLQRLREDLEIGVRLAESLGLDVGDVELPFS